MELILTEDELQNLLSLQILVNVNSMTKYLEKTSQYRLSVHVPIVENNPTFIDVDVKVIDFNNDTIIASKSYDDSELKKSFEEFWNAFPKTDAQDGVENEYNKMRNIDYDSGFESYKNLILFNKLTPEKILIALKYEIYDTIRRTKNSGKNHLIYMRRMKNWLANPSSILTQYREYEHDELCTFDKESRQIIDKANTNHDSTSVYKRR